MLHRLLAGLFALVFASAAQAQTYPDRPIRLIAPFPAGGLADVLARAVGDEMTKIARPAGRRREPRRRRRQHRRDAVATAAPDGYTLLMSSAGILTANPFLYAKMPFDVETAFIPISNVAEMSMLFVVHPKVEAKTLKDFVALARRGPASSISARPASAPPAISGSRCSCMPPASRSRTCPIAAQRPRCRT